jgi:hypothetical protein
MGIMDELAKVLPIAEVYRDLLQPATQEVGKGLESVAKTARFALAPFEYLGNLHDRYLEFLQRVANKTKNQELVEVHPKITGSILDGIKYLEDDSILFDMFVELLSKAVTKEHSHSAHPAFINIINQLSPDEALMVYLFKKKNYEFWEQSDYNQSIGRFNNTRIIRNDFPTEVLTYPDNYTMYINHLSNLQIAGVPEYKNQEPIFEQEKQTGVKIYRRTSFLDFGFLFSKCCIPDESENMMNK